MDEENDDGGCGFDTLHTLECPYCGSLDCWCHTDIPYHELVTHPSATDDELTQACDFFGVLDS